MEIFQDFLKGETSHSNEWEYIGNKRNTVEKKGFIDLAILACYLKTETSPVPYYKQK